MIDSRILELKEKLMETGEVEFKLNDNDTVNMFLSDDVVNINVSDEFGSAMGNREIEDFNAEINTLEDMEELIESICSMNYEFTEDED